LKRSDQVCTEIVPDDSKAFPQAVIRHQFSLSHTDK
jgi:hypothetical protein